MRNRGWILGRRPAHPPARQYGVHSRLRLADRLLHDNVLPIARGAGVIVAIGAAFLAAREGKLRGYGRRRRPCRWRWASISPYAGATVPNRPVLWAHIGFRRRPVARADSTWVRRKAAAEGGRWRHFQYGFQGAGRVSCSCPRPRTSTVSSFPTRWIASATRWSCPPPPEEEGGGPVRRSGRPPPGPT